MAMLDPAMFDPRMFSPFTPQMPNFGMLNMPQSPGFPQQPAQQPAQQPLDILPQNAAPAQYSPQQPAQSPGMFGGLSNALADNSNTLLAMGAGFLGEGYGGGLKGAMVGGNMDREQKTLNQTERLLAERGLSPDVAKVVARNPALLQGVLQQQMGLGGQTNDIKEYEYAKKQGFTGGLSDWMVQKRAGAGEYGLQPVYGKDKDGNTIILQLGKSGQAISSKIPEGVSLSTGVEKIDLGTQWGIMDKKNGQIIGYQPKDLRGAEREKGIGEQQGKEVSAAPGDIRAGENAIGILDQIKTHEYIDRGTGFTSYGNMVRGTGGYDFENLVQGAKSGAFLQAIQQMRGLGSLSNAEGDAATRAISRMDTATSKDAFLKAVDDYEKIVRQGIARAKARLANPSATVPSQVQTGAPVAAAPVDLKSKYGLD